MSGGDSRIEIEVDVNAVRNSLKRLAPEAEKEIRDVVKTTTTKARKLVQGGAPVRTGLLEASIRKRTAFNQRKTRGEVYVVGPARKYAWIVEHGSKAAHNAFAGRKYIERANKQVLPEFEVEIKKSVDRAIKAAGLAE